MEREIFLAFLTKKLAGELPLTERIQLQSAIETNEEYREIHDRLLLHSFNDKLTHDPKETLARVWKQIESGAAPERKPLLRRTYHRVLVAASVIFFIALYWILIKEAPNQYQEGLVTVTTHDQKLDTLLQDGSRIILNEKSEVSIGKDYGKQSRSIILKGDAFFDVAKNANIPMIVQTGPVDILVRGTAFSVENSENELQIQLLRGLVEISDHRNPVHKRLLYPGQTLTVVQNIDNDTQFAIGTLPAKSLLKTIFGNDTLRFHNQPLDSLVLLLQKKYETKIEIRNEALKSRRFSGMFVTETLQEALTALQFTNPFSFKIVDQKTIIE